jgi:ketosteroid isomerase-like protein
MAELMMSNLETDGERREFAAHGHAAIAHAGAASVMRGTFEPGWRWSADVAPIAGTDSCQVGHHLYVLAGAMTVRMNDGTETTLRAGDLADVAPGHDAWVEGDEACVSLDMSPHALTYAMKRPAGIEAPEDRYMALVRRGYDAFNTGDVEALMELFASDVVQHVPGDGPLAGTYKGTEAVLTYYAKLGEMTDGTFRARLVDLHGDGLGHVTAVHQTVAQRNGSTRVNRGSILFSFVGDKAHDLLELHGDLPGDDAFLG